MAALSSACLMIEEKSRIQEIAMYVFPRWIESVPLYYRKTNLWPKNSIIGDVKFFLIFFNYFKHIVFALAVGIVSMVYNRDYKAVKISLRWVVNLVCGESDDESIKKIEARDNKEEVVNDANAKILEI